MRNLIVYISNHGCAEKIAKRISDELKGSTKIINLREEKPTDIEHYDKIILGGSIHAGKVQKKLTSFIRKNENIINTKKHALYLCCMYEGEQAISQLNNAYPEKLRKSAIATEILGGEFDFGKMNFIEKVIIKKIANVEESVSKIKNDKIQEFIDKLNSIND